MYIQVYPNDKSPDFSLYGVLYHLRNKINIKLRIEVASTPPQSLVGKVQSTEQLQRMECQCKVTLYMVL